MCLPGRSEAKSADRRARLALAEQAAQQALAELAAAKAHRDDLRRQYGLPAGGGKDGSLQGTRGGPEARTSTGGQGYGVPGAAGPGGATAGGYGGMLPPSGRTPDARVSFAGHPGGASTAPSLLVRHGDGRMSTGGQHPSTQSQAPGNTPWQGRPGRASFGGHLPGLPAAAGPLPLPLEQLPASRPTSATLTTPRQAQALATWLVLRSRGGLHAGGLQPLCVDVATLELQCQRAGRLLESHMQVLAAFLAADKDVQRALNASDKVRPWGSSARPRVTRVGGHLLSGNNGGGRCRLRLLATQDGGRFRPVC